MVTLFWVYAALVQERRGRITELRRGRLSASWLSCGADLLLAIRSRVSVGYSPVALSDLTLLFRYCTVLACVRCHLTWAR